MYIDNNWYSHKKIFSDYCEVKEKPCFASIQHGWYPFISNPKKPFIRSAPYLCWNRRTFNELNENNIKNVIIIGSPFIYLTKLLENKINNNYPQGTIFFPAHTVPKTDKPIKAPKRLKNILSDIDVETEKKINHELLINYIEKISPKPFTVCLSYTDYVKENIEIYQNRGWKVISLGSRNNPEMLFNFYREVIKYENVISSELGSAVFYALYLKKKVKVMFEINGNNINGNKNNSYIKMIFYKNFPKLFDDFLSGEDGYKLACEELGSQNIFNKYDLINILGWDNWYKIFFARIYSLRNYL